MAPSLNRNNLMFDNIGALSHLVEAASALTELEVKEPSTKKGQSTALVSDDDEISRITSKTTGDTSGPSKPRKKEIFPQKLMEILADSSLSEIVSWLPHGRSFVIIRPDLFCEEVLPRYLPPADSRGSTKYPSFTRKLNRWGFRQATRGADTGAFHHPFFRRDQPVLCMKMVCQKSRDRQQQGPQKQRSLPPKKRSIHQAAPPPFCSSQQIHPPIIASADASVTTSPSYRLGQAVAPISADDRSIGNSSTTSQTSSHSSSVVVNNNNSYLAAAKIKSPLPPNTTAATAATGTSNTMEISTTKSRISSGVMPFVSNDTQFVASILKQRESLEVYRAAKAMLYDAFMKAVNEEAR